MDVLRDELGDQVHPLHLHQQVAGLRLRTVPQAIDGDVSDEREEGLLAVGIGQPFLRYLGAQTPTQASGGLEKPHLEAWW